MKLIAGMFFKYHGDDKKVETKCETLILMYLLVILINQSYANIVTELVEIKNATKNLRNADSRYFQCGFAFT